MLLLLGKKEIFNNWCNQKYVYMYLFYLLDEQVFLIESHRKKTLKIKIADLEADLEVFQFKHFQLFCTCRKKMQLPTQQLNITSRGPSKM